MEQNGGFNYKELRRKEQKFVRYKEGSQLYSMGMSKFQKIQTNCYRLPCLFQNKQQSGFASGSSKKWY
jgi:hypothetical protein